MLLLQFIPLSHYEQDSWIKASTERDKVNQYQYMLMKINLPLNIYQVENNVICKLHIDIYFFLSAAMSTYHFSRNNFTENVRSEARAH